MNNTILMEEAYWMNSQLSVARFYGRIDFNGVSFIIVNKEGKDLLQCSIEADRAGREKAIESGEPADLIRADFQKYYKKFGREKFIQILSENRGKKVEEIRKIMKSYGKESN